MGQFPEIFRDPIWSFGDVVVGLIFGIIATALAIYAIRQQTRKKSFAYAVEKYALLNPSAQEMFGEAIDHLPAIDVIVDGVPLDDPSVVTVAVANTGNVAIRRIDFEETPIVIDYGGNSRIISPLMIGARPKEAATALSLKIVDDRKVEIEPMLLNPSDSLDVRCMVENAGNTTVTARLADIPEIKEVALSEIWSPTQKERGPLWGILGIIIVITLYTIAGMTRADSDFSLDMYLAVFLLFVLWGYFWIKYLRLQSP